MKKKTRNIRECTRERIHGETLQVMQDIGPSVYHHPMSRADTQARLVDRCYNGGIFFSSRLHSTPGFIVGALHHYVSFPRPLYGCMENTACTMKMVAIFAHPSYPKSPARPPAPFGGTAVPLAFVADGQFNSSALTAGYVPKMLPKIEKQNNQAYLVGAVIRRHDRRRR